MYRIVNVSKSYGNTSVLKNVTLTLPTTGLVALIGKSGSGKSTLLNMLTGIDKPSSGEIFYLNKNLCRLKTDELKCYQNQEIGILFQHFNLFNELTSLENVVMPALIKGTRREEANKLAKELFNHYHLEKLINQKYGTLSGGEKQRVALLRALINNPKVILADEPTGALDTNNSVLIMEELKKLSKNHLVIVVSHNIELIKQYEDIRITIQDGRIEKIINNLAKVPFSITKKTSNISFVAKFLRLHLQKHWVRNAISTAAIAFSSLCFLLASGYINGAKSSMAEYQTKSLLYNYATISKKTIYDLPNSPIKISKLTRPNDEEVDFLFEAIPNLYLGNNYQYVMPSMPKFIFENKEYSDIEFAPVYDFTLDEKLLISGRVPSLDFTEVVVNSEFLRHFGYDKTNVLNATLKLSQTTTINNKHNGTTIKDTLAFSDQLKIVGVVDEFAYLNTPRIYYSYIGLQNKLKNATLTNYSVALGYLITVDEVISLAKEDDPNSAYSYSIFVLNLSDVHTLYKLKEEHDAIDDFDISSNCYLVGNSYSEMTEIISSSLIVFIGLTLFSAIAIVTITAYANYTQNKQESAILSVLGAKRTNIFTIFGSENILVSLVGLLTAFIIAIPAQNIANNIIMNSFHLNNLITVPFASILTLLIFLCVILLSALATFIPFIFYEKGYVIEELKDE